VDKIKELLFDLSGDRTPNFYFILFFKYYKRVLQFSHRFILSVDEIRPAVCRGPTVLEESMEVRVREPDGDTERKRQ
jgi:hypothetical protein